jgi:hypothetical protein
MNNDTDDFDSRTHEQEITEEFVKHACEMPLNRAEDALRAEVKRFERSYNAVAEVTKCQRGVGESFKIRVIAAIDANPKEIQRGLQSIQHYLANPPEESYE